MARAVFVEKMRFFEFLQMTRYFEGWEGANGLKSLYYEVTNLKIRKGWEQEKENVTENVTGKGHIYDIFHYKLRLSRDMQWQKYR